jgi:G3E family GTPase
MGTIVNVVSGFLGAGKTTLIRSLMEGPLKDRRIAIIENEFGEIGIDGEILKSSGIRVREINSGCICCSLSGDFRIALREIADEYSPEVIIIEPSGIAKASDIVEVCRSAGPEITQGSVITVVDARKYFSQIRNFREFYRDQVMQAGIVLLTRTDEAGEEKTIRVIEDISSINPEAHVTTDLDDVLSMAMDGMNTQQTVSQDHDNKGEGLTIGLESYCFETNLRYDEDDLSSLLEELVQSDRFGEIIRVKGMLQGLEGFALKADCMGNEAVVEKVDSFDSGKICFIGKGLRRDSILRFMEDGRS